MGSSASVHWRAVLGGHSSVNGADGGFLASCSGRSVARCASKRAWNMTAVAMTSRDRLAALSQRPRRPVLCGKSSFSASIHFCVSSKRSTAASRLAESAAAAWSGFPSCAGANLMTETSSSRFAPLHRAAEGSPNVLGERIVHSIRLCGI